MTPIVDALLVFALLQSQARDAQPAQPRSSSVSHGLLQRCGDHPCPETGCGREEHPLARALDAGPAPAAVPASVHGVLRSPGAPIDADLRAAFEPRFGHDFSAVRVHADGAAGASARDVGALAYTVGEHVVFAPGRYAPATEPGRRLIAHELTHVIQQRGQSRPDLDALRVGDVHDPAEREADHVAGRLRGALQGGAPSSAVDGRGSTRTLVIGENDDRMTRTADTGTVSTTAPVGGPTSVFAGACTSVSGTSILPSGTLTPTLTGTDFSASWDMAADFTSTPADPAVCGPCGEYRQYVRGSFTRNGSPVTHKLCGVNLDPTSFNEDCALIAGKQYKYGYHSIKFATSNFYNPDQATGQRWEGYDAPGLGGSSGDTLAIDLEFMGGIIDDCNGKSLGGSTWKVKGSTTIP